MRHEELDEVDRIILDVLQENAKTAAEGDRDTGLSVYARGFARIEKMEKEGIITGYRAQVNPEALGYHIKALINLEVPPRIKRRFILL